jgi:hypothetical protein
MTKYHRKVNGTFRVEITGYITLQDYLHETTDPIGKASVDADVRTNLAGKIWTAVAETELLRVDGVQVYLASLWGHNISEPIAIDSEEE